MKIENSIYQNKMYASLPQEIWIEICKVSCFGNQISLMRTCTSFSNLNPNILAEFMLEGHGTYWNVENYTRHRGLSMDMENNEFKEWSQKVFGQNVDQIIAIIEKQFLELRVHASAINYLNIISGVGVLRYSN